MQMAVLNSLFRTHLGTSEDQSGLSNWMIWLKRDSKIYTTSPKGTIKDFRACDQLFNHVLDGHILAAMATEVGAADCFELDQILQKINWRKAIKSLQQKYHSPTLISDQREELGHRNIPYENAVLFLQHGLVYCEFSDAVRHGDTGRVELALKIFAIWFQATSNSNYASELLHIVACLKSLWTPDFKGFWLDNCLVNISGSPHGFMPCDQLGEYIVREIKSLIHHNRTLPNDLYLRQTLSRLVMDLLFVRRQMLRTTEATDYYQHSSIVNASSDVRMVADTLLRSKTFDKSNLGQSGSNLTTVSDLFGIGAMKIWNGQVIYDYVQARLKNAFDKRDDTVDEDHIVEHDVDNEDRPSELDIIL